MDVTIVNPFLKTTINMFLEMFHFKPNYGKPHVVSSFGNHRWEISGVIGLVGSVQGVVVIRLTKVLAERLLHKSGLETSSPEEESQLIDEMVGEFVNIISGNALDELSGRDLDISVPVTIQGKNHTIAWPNRGPIIGIPFYTPYGPFEVQVNISSEDRKTRELKDLIR